MAYSGPDTDQLLKSAAEGDAAAKEQLLNHHRPRLQQMVAIHLDNRLAARFDPSDVVQEAMIDAHAQLSDYLRQRPVPFYPWLRKITWEHLMKFQRQHLHAHKRSVRREAPQGMILSDESALALVKRLASQSSSPSDRLIRSEVRQRVRDALNQLSERDRELLILRYLEQMPLAEIASVMQTTERAVKTRHFRALQRMHRLLNTNETGNET